MLQKLSPQQIMLMKLLQLPLMELEQRIKEEIEENPALEEVNDHEDYEDEPISDDDNDDNDDDYNSEENSYDKDDEFDFTDYFSDDEEDYSYKLQANNRSRDDDQYETPVTNEQTFQEYLTQQLGYRNLDEKKYKIGACIIGNLDDSGYLSRPIEGLIDDLLFTMNLEATEDEVKEVLHVIQTFDPPGIGASDLQECLLIQLKRLEEDNPDVDYSDAIIIIRDYFEEFTKKHYDKILRKADISGARLKTAMDEILKLNPKPGDSSSENSKNSHYVIPDFIIYNNDGELELVLNNRNAPELRVNKAYVKMLDNFSKEKESRSKKEAVQFVKQKIDSAKWFIDAIQQRQNTLYVTMKTIMDFQKDYFLSGDETKLKPMILKDIADKVGLDISTISRVANSKYVQTAYGTFLLKTFFSEGMMNDEGEEVSTREIKKILKDCIEAEDKSNPLTDEELAAILKGKGYPIARRTIAKYREQLGVPVARLRKEI
jgi:RNA polymerase sigma-54 factor